MKDFIDLQQVYNERVLVTPEIVAADGSSFCSYASNLCGLILLRLFQHPNHFYLLGCHPMLQSGIWRTCHFSLRRYLLFIKYIRLKNIQTIPYSLSPRDS